MHPRYSEKKPKSKIQSIAIYSECVKGNIYIQALKPLKITKLPQTFVIELQSTHRCLNSEGTLQRAQMHFRNVCFHENYGNRFPLSHRLTAASWTALWHCGAVCRALSSCKAGTFQPLINFTRCLPSY